MRIWLTKNAPVPVRQQLVEQIILGVASGDLQHGERLPSTRDLARRFGVHPNTISAAYRELATRGVVDFRKGSGVFVINGTGSKISELSIQRLIRRLLDEAWDLGYSSQAVHELLGNTIYKKRSRTICVVESDHDLRAILVEEISGHLNREVHAIEPDEIGAIVEPEAYLFAALFDERAKLLKLLPHGNDCIFLNASSIPDSLNRRERPSDDEIIAVVSNWPTFISLAQLILIAAKVHPNAIIHRSTNDPDWQHGLSAASIIISDAYTAKTLGNEYTVEVFKLINQESIDELRRNLDINM